MMEKIPSEIMQTIIAWVGCGRYPVLILPQRIAVIEQKRSLLEELKVNTWFVGRRVLLEGTLSLSDDYRYFYMAKHMAMAISENLQEFRDGCHNPYPLSLTVMSKLRTRFFEDGSTRAVRIIGIVHQKQFFMIVEDRILLSFTSLPCFQST